MTRAPAPVVPQALPGAPLALVDRRPHRPSGRTLLVLFGDPPDEVT